MLLGLGLGVLWSSSGAGAAESPRPARALTPILSLHVSPCLAAVLDESEIARLVAIELGPGRPASPVAGPPRLHAQIDCSDGSPQLADLTVEEHGSGRALMRTVDLAAQAQPLHARLIALSLAELVHAVDSERWEESHATPPSPPAPTSPRPQGPPPAPVSGTGSPPPAIDAAPAEPRPQPPRGLYLQGGLALLVPLAGPGAPLHVGAGLRLGGDHPYHLSWDVDAQVVVARRRTSLGELESNLLSSRATLQAHLAWSRLILRGGLGLRAGAVRLVGSPGDGALAMGRETWAPFGGPLLSLGAGFAPLSPRRLRTDLALEGGYLLWSATARVDGQTSLAIAGPWLGLSLSLGLSL